MDIKIESFAQEIELLFKHSIDNLLPTNHGKSKLSESVTRKLLGLSSLLSISNDPKELYLSYEIISRLVESKTGCEQTVNHAADIILSRIGNFPGRTLLRNRNMSLSSFTPPLSLSLERLAREVENTTDDGVLLTDFQHRLYSSLESYESLSISAPTSAGKSFILNLDLVRRLKSGEEINIIYIVPTRALISEVSSRIRSTIRNEELTGVLVRTAPFPIKDRGNIKNIIYVLTPERLLSLLKPENNKKIISSIFVDEAHEIQKRNRGITLQSAIDLALRTHPKASIFFASPLISNPGYFLSLFNRLEEGLFFTETISPVSQNLLLISEVPQRPQNIHVQLLAAGRTFDIGSTIIGLKFRGSKSKQRAGIANEITLENESTIIFANGPGEAETVAEELQKIGRPFDPNDHVLEFISFIKSEIHPEYPLAETLKGGIAFHYGDMPSIIRSGIEELFRTGSIRFLCCTSTLLQGVNLPAKHIVIENPHSGDTPMTRSDFLNLSGRAGRLLHEFHGNIWCIRPGEWEEKSYMGEKLQTIKSSMEGIMGDGGSLIAQLLKGQVSDEDKDFAEAGLSRLYHETHINGELETLLKYGNPDNQSVLSSNIEHIKSMSITLPQNILDAHSGLRPDHLQNLYKALKNSSTPVEMSLINPFQQGGKRKMTDAMELISNVFNWAESPRFRGWVGTLAHKWVTGEPISSLIRERVNYKRSEDEKTKTSPIIRELLKVIEKEIRFKLVKYFSAFEDILKHILIEQGLSESYSKQAPYHTYLEFGSCSPVELSLMSLGFSRFTAIKLKNSVDWGTPTEIEDYLDALKRSDLDKLKLPRLCRKEISEVIGQS